MCGIWAIFGSADDVHEEVTNCYKIAHRGPDCFRFENVNHFQNCAFGFHRLAIVDDLNGMQPMRIVQYPHIWMIYNGEIYNYKQLGEKFDLKYQTNCDGESLIHLYAKGGIEFMCEQLYGVFGFILFDTQKQSIFCGRDTFGVRPVFRVFTDDGILAVCSEAKGLLSIQFNNTTKTSKIEAVKPGSYEEYKIEKNGNLAGKVSFVKAQKYHAIGTYPKYDVNVSLTEDVYENIRRTLINAVRMRLMSHRRIGCLLSGGLDSSLVTGLLVQEARKAGINYPIQTFSIGMGEESPDVLAARKVAEHLKTEHHEVIFTAEDAIKSIPDVIKSLESYDVTTIRASIGMYLISKYIKEKTDTVVIFSGEGSDEIAQGYIYFYKAPTPEEGHEESLRLCNDLYLFDVLRGDRTTAAHGLELRVPFLDHFFSATYFSIPAADRMALKDRCEKYLIRKAFDGLNIIPNEILWRPKEAFSDGVASKKKSLFQYIQEFVEDKVTQAELDSARERFPLNTPLTKEAYYFRNIFSQLYPNCDHFTPYMWLPKWCGQIVDPSARILSHYNEQQDKN